MALVKGQNIPSEFLKLYTATLLPAAKRGGVRTNCYNTFKYNQGKYKSQYYIRLRPPWQLPATQGRDDIHSSTIAEIASSTPYSWRRKHKGTPSAAQLWVRNTFLKSVDCFRQQPRWGMWDAISPGPRGRDYWFQIARDTGLFYYSNFMKLTLTPMFGVRVFSWNGPREFDESFAGEDGVFRWPHDFIKGNEPAFLDFYSQMSTLYGWSWTAASDPDEIAHTMCRCIFTHIAPLNDFPIDTWRTPGETCARLKGDCEDKAILLYMMIAKTLWDIGNSTAYILFRLACVAYISPGGGHVIVGWKDNDGEYRALPVTGWIGTPGNSRADCPYLIPVIKDTATFLFTFRSTRDPYERGVGKTPVWCTPGIPYLIVPGAVSSQMDALARSSSGLLYCVFMRKVNDITQIFFAVSEDQANNWVITQITDENYDQMIPSIAIDTHDTIHIVWEGKHAGSPSYRQVRYRKFDGIWHAIENLTSEDYEVNPPFIETDSNDHVHIVWNSKHAGSPSRRQIRYRKFTTHWEEIQNLTTDPALEQSVPQIKIDKTNNVHIIWTGWDDSFLYQLRYRKFTTHWEEIQNLTSGNHNQFRASLAFDENNYLHLVWYGQHPGSPQYYQVRYRKFTTHWGEIQNLTVDPFHHYSPNISIAKNGLIAIVWSSPSPISPHLCQIHLKKFTTTWQPPQILPFDLSQHQRDPCTLSSIHPIIDDKSPNRPKEGFCFAFRNGDSIYFFASEELSWE